MNKSLVMFSFLTLLAISCASSRKKPIIKENGVIADMVLMYYGGAHRQTEWNEEQCMKNVAYRDKKGDLHWMFDGFLFLEFKDRLGQCQNNLTRMPGSSYFFFYIVNAAFNSIQSFTFLKILIAQAFPFTFPSGHGLIIGSKPTPFSILEF